MTARRLRHTLTALAAIMLAATLTALAAIVLAATFSLTAATVAQAGDQETWGARNYVLRQSTDASHRGIKKKKGAN